MRRLRQRRLVVKAEVGGGDKDIFDRYEKWRRDRRIKWRLWKFEMIDKWEAKKQELKYSFPHSYPTHPPSRETQFVVSWLETLAYLRQKLDPVYRVWYWLMERFADFYFGYDDFLSEESKRMWKWSNTYELEINFWREAITYFQRTFTFKSYLLLICVFRYGYHVHVPYFCASILV